MDGRSKSNWCTAVVIGTCTWGYSMIQRILALSLLPLTSVVAQRFDPPGNIVPIAVTYCHLADSVAPSFTVTFIDAALVGSDSLPEILTHERVHDRMNRDSLAAGRCPGPASDIHAQLGRELLAYCSSDSVRVLRTHDPVEAGRTTVERLLNQFNGKISMTEIVLRWARACPRFAWGVTEAGQP